MRRYLKERTLKRILFPLDPEQGFAIAGETFKERWLDHDAAIILNPHDPTGTSLSETLITDLTHSANERDKLLIIDETLRDYTNNASFVEHAVATPNVIILRTFSTFHALAGLRLGYCIGDEDILSCLKQMMEPWPLNSLAPVAALASLKDKGYRERTAQFLSTEREYALKKLQGIDRTKPIPTPWGLFIRIQTAVAQIKSLLADEGILIDAYKDAQENQYLAFPFRSRPANARFFRALRWILRK